MGRYKSTPARRAKSKASSCYSGGKSQSGQQSPLICFFFAHLPSGRCFVAKGGRLQLKRKILYSFLMTRESDNAGDITPAMEQKKAAELLSVQEEHGDAIYQQTLAILADPKYAGLSVRAAVGETEGWKAVLAAKPWARADLELIRLGNEAPRELEMESTLQYIERLYTIECRMQLEALLAKPENKDAEPDFDALQPLIRQTEWWKDADIRQQDLIEVLQGLNELPFSSD